MRQFFARRFLRLSVSLAVLITFASTGGAARVRADDSVFGLIGKLFTVSESHGKSREKSASDAPQSHEFKKVVKIRSTDGGNGVQTFCIDGQGRILALVAPPRYFDGTSKSAACEVHVLSPLGDPITQWKLDFLGQSINAGADGKVYVAGDGKIAQLSADGNVLKKLELPYVAAVLKDKDGLRKRAEEESRQQARSTEQIRKQFRERIKELEAKPADKLTRFEKRNLEQFKRSLEMFDKDSNRPSVDAMVQSIVARLRIINSVAVSEKDIFVVCGETSGYGYSLWRLDHDFQNPKQIMKGLRGCCGQMDVQVQANDVMVAENCEHAFARYDRDGKKLGQWGTASQSGDVKCFGGCCNPMNVRCAANGDVLTAESEGFVKRFNSKGEFVSVVGKRALSGGCKNVAVASSPDGKLVYMCDLPGSQIVIFAEKPKAVAQTK